MEPTVRPMFAGFWIRLVADIVDVILLAVVGVLLAIPLGGIFSRLGPHGPWVGLVISFLYAGLLQSALGQGQSLGKRLLRIQVLRLDGAYLSLPASFLRHGMLALISYGSLLSSLLDPILPDRIEGGFDLAITVLCVILFLGCVILVSMHPLKRGLHDLIAGSLVVYKGRYDGAAVARLADPERERKALGFLGLTTALLLIAGATLILMGNALQGESGVPAGLAQEVGQATGHDRLSMDLIEEWRIGERDARPRRSLVITVPVDRAHADDNAYVAGEAQRVAQTVARIAKEPVDQITVRVVAGFHIGIASASISREVEFNGAGEKLGL